ncbi:MAG: hypothetical protein PGN07_05445 [Aeromicrobium erythreum]
MSAVVALAVAGAVHLGFQATVSVAVYPALVSTRADDFAVVHAAHSRRITYLVVPVYGLLVLGGGWAVVADTRPLVLAGVAAHGLALLTTALVAAPTHGRLGTDGPTPDLLRRLVRSDMARTTCAAVGLALSLAAIAT